MPVDREFVRQLANLLRPLATRMQNAAARAVLQLVDDSTKLQLLQIGVLEGETIDGAEHVQPYGFSSVPHAGADTAAVVFPNGDRGHPLVVGVADRRHRPTGGQAGEVVIYTDEGDTIRLGRGHVIALATSGQVRLGSASAAGAVVVQDALTGAQGFTAALAAAITANPGPIAAALTALQTALTALNGSTGWKAGTTKTKAE